MHPAASGILTCSTAVRMWASVFAEHLSPVSWLVKSLQIMESAAVYRFWEAPCSPCAQESESVTTSPALFAMTVYASHSAVSARSVNWLEK